MIESSQDNGSGSARPLVSVSIPVYNAECHVAEALSSVLAQSHANLEAVVSDDASTDRSAEILLKIAARDTRVRLFLQDKNLGVTANCNFVLEQMRGEFVCFFSGDDVLKPECIERMLLHMSRDPDLAVVFHRTGFIDRESNPLPSTWTDVKTHVGTLQDFLRRGVYVGLNGMLVRRSFLEGCTFDPSLPHASDFSILYDLLEKPRARFLFLAEELSFWRKHESSLTMARAAECTREAMHENYEVASRFPKYARYALQRTKVQALTLPRAQREPALRFLLMLAFSSVAHWCDVVLSGVLGVRSIDAWRKSLLSRL